MSLSRSPSPVPGGGWASPGLNISGSGRSSPAKASASFSTMGLGGASVGAASAAWDSAARIKSGMGAFGGQQTTTTSTTTTVAGGAGFFTRHMRRISTNLPRFNTMPSAAVADDDDDDTPYAEREKMGRVRGTGAGGFWAAASGSASSGGWAAGLRRNVPLITRMRSLFSRMGRKVKIRLAICLVLLLSVWLFFHTPLYYYYVRSPHLGGGSKYVIILGANVGGGVMEWKGAREWAIERDSVRNKRRYVERWGYDLEIVDMATKKRYAHEWRESWEKVDAIRNCLRKYPKAEWFWWLDLNTFIMEPSYSLQSHLFTDMERKIYRDINDFNPLNISHPFTEPYLDPASRSPQGDGDVSSVNLILPQDCSGFNMGSFLVRRSAWTERLLDVWWDPVAYEQKHMEWEHKEQDALEQLYTTQPWIRSHVGFIPQRMLNSFPPGACSENGNDTRIHYDQKDRDFVVNMAGCEWGRDCWGEMYNYRELSYYLNRSWWERFKEDWVAVAWYKLTGRKVKL